jgi:hypothetical protein
MWVWLCTNTTLELSWSNYLSTTPLYSTAKQRIKDLTKSRVSTSPWHSDSVVLHLLFRRFSRRFEFLSLGLFFTVVVLLPVMRPNLPFVSAKHTLVTYNITLSLITKTNQGARCFQSPPFWWLMTTLQDLWEYFVLKFLSIERMVSYTQ